MGFDVHGLNPKINQSMNDYETLSKYRDMDFGDRMKAFDKDDSIRKKYYDELDKYENSNIGIYFRNNVWFWRPLWAFVCDNCNDILSARQMTLGNSNDGVEIEDEEAVAIHDRIMIDIGEEQILKMHAEYEQMRQEAKENNKGKKLGDEGYNWEASYPFDADNVIRFAKFCKESGGFTIC